MKTSKNTALFRTIGTLGFCSLAILFLTSWSPPSGDGIELGYGDDLSMGRGVINMNPHSESFDANHFHNQPALIIGIRNNLFVGLSLNDRARGIVAGVDNTLATGWNPSSIIGRDNHLSGGRTMVSGNSNLVAGPNSSFGNYADLTYDTAVFGYNNQVYAQRAFAIGFDNIADATDAVAIGSGLDSTNESGTALGRYNTPMESEDVLVVGTGDNDSNRTTALRITDDGAVILGRAQGDISMGAYQ